MNIGFRILGFGLFSEAASLTTIGFEHVLEGYYKFASRLSDLTPLVSYVITKTAY